MNMHLTLNAHFKGANNLVQYMYFFRLDKNGYLLISQTDHAYSCEESIFKSLNRFLLNSQ